MNAAGRKAEGAVENGFLAVNVFAVKGDAHALDAHDFEDFDAGLLKEIVGGAVDAHAAADLVDEAEFFVGVGKMSGEGIKFTLERAEAELVFECSEHEAGLAVNVIFGVGDEFLGLLAKPGTV